MKYFFLSCVYNIKSNISLKWFFLAQVFALLLSNLIFFSFWWIFFENFESISGWKIQDMMCLCGVVSGGYGVSCIFMGGSRYLSQMIITGTIDVLLLKPKNIILSVYSARSLPQGWGDLITSMLLIGWSEYCNIKNVVLIIFLIFSSSLIITLFATLLGSIAFWIKDSETLGKQIFEFILTFSNYPEKIYEGVVKLVLYSLIPSAFIGFIPINIIRNFNAFDFVSLLLFDIIYFFITYVIFISGLKIYNSGNKINLDY